MTSDIQTDIQLLSRFTHSNDKAAYEKLVQRHAPMVYRVCMRILSDHQDQWPPSIDVVHEKNKKSLPDLQLDRYVYLPPQTTGIDGTPAKTVVAHCKPEHHKNSGVHVLYADGSVKWIELRNRSVGEVIHSSR